MDTCVITVIEQDDIGGEPMQKVNLMHGESRTRVCDYVLNATLVHRDNVGIAFYHENRVFLAYRLLCLVDTIEFVIFMIDY